MLSLHWFRHWDKIFWVLFLLMGVAIVFGGFYSLISFEFAVVLGFFMVIIGAGKLGDEISGQKLVNYQDDIYRKLHQVSQHLETTFNLADSHKAKTEFRLSKMDLRRKEMETEMDRKYRDVARKVLDMDNKLNKVAKIMIERERQRLQSTESTFTEKVLSLAKMVPRGKVTTYSEIARAMGRPKYSRSAGRVISANSHLKSIPLHRVVKADGKIDGKPSAVKKRTALLRKEGVRVAKNKVDMDRHMFYFMPEI